MEKIVIRPSFFAYFVLAIIASFIIGALLGQIIHLIMFLIDKENNAFALYGFLLSFLFFSIYLSQYKIVVKNKTITIRNSIFSLSKTSISFENVTKMFINQSIKNNSSLYGLVLTDIDQELHINLRMFKRKGFLLLCQTVVQFNQSIEIDDEIRNLMNQTLINN